MTDDVFKALSDPSRRKIVDMLNQEGEMSAGDIAARFSISAPSVSHHLAILRAAGLVADVRRRQSIVYHLQRAALQEAYRWMEGIMTQPYTY